MGNSESALNDARSVEFDQQQQSPEGRTLRSGKKTTDLPPPKKRLKRAPHEKLPEAAHDLTVAPKTREISESLEDRVARYLQEIRTAEELLDGPTSVDFLEAEVCDDFSRQECVSRARRDELLALRAEREKALEDMVLANEKYSRALGRPTFPLHHHYNLRMRTENLEALQTVNAELELQYTVLSSEMINLRKELEELAATLKEPLSGINWELLTEANIKFIKDKTFQLEQLKAQRTATGKELTEERDKLEKLMEVNLGTSNTDEEVDEPTVEVSEDFDAEYGDADGWNSDVPDDSDHDPHYEDDGEASSGEEAESQGGQAENEEEEQDEQVDEEHLGWDLDPDDPVNFKIGTVPIVPRSREQKNLQKWIYDVFEYRVTGVLKTKGIKLLVRKYFEEKGLVQYGQNIMNIVGQYMRGKAKSQTRNKDVFLSETRKRQTEDSRLKPNLVITYYGKTEFKRLVDLPLSHIVDKE